MAPNVEMFKMILAAVVGLALTVIPEPGTTATGVTILTGLGVSALR